MMMDGDENQDPFNLLLQAAETERRRHREEQHSMGLWLVQKENERLAEELRKTRVELERQMARRTPGSVSRRIRLMGPAQPMRSICLWTLIRELIPPCCWELTIYMVLVMTL
jgi:hypothetical protein